MRIGIPTEIKNHEDRVALTPVGAHELTSRGHEVLVQAGAGHGSGFTDHDFAAQGATIVATADDVWAAADLVVKVKEPLPQEYPLMRRGQTLFTYLHLAADPTLTRELLERRVTSLAYETVQQESGLLPLLRPMSEVAGCLAPQMGARWLTADNGGPGLLLGGVAGVPSAKVVVIGGGVAGLSATTMALGLGAEVTVIDSDLDKLRTIHTRFGGRVHQLPSSRLTISEQVAAADLVIGTVLIPGASAPKLVTRDMVARMRPGSVLVDVAIDQGGCFEGSHPTTHSDPVFTVEGATYYCVANMPGAVPHTSTWALTQATLPYLVRVADRGWLDALRDDPALAKGLSTHDGRLFHPGVARAHGLECSPVEPLLEERGDPSHRVAE